MDKLHQVNLAVLLSYVNLLSFTMFKQVYLISAYNSNKILS